MITSDSEYVTRVDQLYSLLGTVFLNDLPSFFVNGLGETVAINTETSEEALRDEEQGLYNTVAELVSFLIIDQVGLFPTHLFSGDILEDEEYFRYILARTLLTLYPKIFFILDGIKVGLPSDYEITTGTVNDYNIFISAKNLFNDIDVDDVPRLSNSLGISLNKQYVEKTDDKDQIYANLKINERRVRLETAIDMITENSFLHHRYLQRDECKSKQVGLQPGVWEDENSQNLCERSCSIYTQPRFRNDFERCLPPIYNENLLHTRLLSKKERLVN